MSSAGGDRRLTAGTGPHEASEGARPILVIDDDPALRSLFGLMLTRAGFETIPVATGAEALRVVQARPVSLVLVDLNMPGMSGLDLAAALRQRPETALLPIIVVTGSADEATRIGARRAGANDVLVKPVGLDELVTRVRTHLPAPAGAPPKDEGQP